MADSANTLWPDSSANPMTNVTITCLSGLPIGMGDPPLDVSQVQKNLYAAKWDGIISNSESQVRLVGKEQKCRPILTKQILA